MRKRPRLERRVGISVLHEKECLLNPFGANTVSRRPPFTVHDFTQPLRVRRIDCAHLSQESHIRGAALLHPRGESVANGLINRDALTQ
jgi:hypothetical protein